MADVTINGKTVSVPGEIPQPATLLQQRQAQVKSFLSIKQPSPKSPFGSHLQTTTVKSANTVKDIQDAVGKATTKVDALNEIDLCNLISYFINKGIPKGSDFEKQFQNLKKTANTILQEIENTQTSIVQTPFKSSSITPPAGLPLTGSATGSGNTANSYGATPAQANNISGSNAFYGGGGAFSNPLVAVSNTTNAGTSANLDSTLQQVRALKGVLQKVNIPDAVLKVIPGGKNILDSIKKLTSQIPDNVSNFPNEDIKKMFTTFDTLKTTLNGIAHAQNPADLVSVFAAKSAIGKLQDTLNPAQLIPALNAIVKSVTAINTVLKTLSTSVSRMSSAVNSLNSVVQTLKKFISTIDFLAIPARFTTVGMISKLQTIKAKLKDQVDQAAANIEQASFFLNTYSAYLTSVQVKITYLLQSLNLLLAKLKACEKTSSLPVVAKLEDAIIQLNANQAALASILPKVPTAPDELTYKGYTLKIIEEQATDTGVVLTRRYGVALDSRGVIFVKTDLTYANNKNLIFNELRYLIDKNTTSTTSPVVDDVDLAISQQLDLPTEQEQVVNLAEAQAEIDNLIKQIPAEENLRKQRSKKDQRKFNRLKRVIKRLKGQGLSKNEIKYRVLNTKVGGLFGSRFSMFTAKDFEEAWNELGYTQ